MSSSGNSNNSSRSSNSNNSSSLLDISKYVVLNRKRDVQAFQRTLFKYLRCVADELSRIQEVNVLLDFSPVLLQWENFLLCHYYLCLFTPCLDASSNPYMSYYYSSTTPKGAGGTLAAIDSKGALKDEFKELFEDVNVSCRPSMWFFYIYLKILYLHLITKEARENPSQQQHSFLPVIDISNVDRLNEESSKLVVLFRRWSQQQQQQQQQHHQSPSSDKDCCLLLSEEGIRTQLYTFLWNLYGSIEKKVKEAEQDANALSSIFSPENGNTNNNENNSNHMNPDTHHLFEPHIQYLLTFGCHLFFGLLCLCKFNKLLLTVANENEGDDDNGNTTITSTSTTTGLEEVMIDTDDVRSGRFFGHEKYQDSINNLLTLQIYHMNTKSDDSDIVPQAIERWLYQMMIAPGLRECYMLSKGFYSVVSNCHQERVILEANFTKRSQFAMRTYDLELYKKIFDGYRWFLEDYKEALAKIPECCNPLGLILFHFLIQERFHHQSFLFRFVIPFEGIVKYPDKILFQSMKIPLFIAVQLGEYGILYKRRIFRSQYMPVLVHLWLKLVSQSSEFAGIPAISSISEEAPWVFIWLKCVPADVNINKMLSEKSRAICYRDVIDWGQHVNMPKEYYDGEKQELSTEESRMLELQKLKDRLNHTLAFDGSSSIDNNSSSDRELQQTDNDDDDTDK